jgi:hypothetical protein
MQDWHPVPFRAKNVQPGLAVPHYNGAGFDRRVCFDHEEQPKAPVHMQPRKEHPRADVLQIEYRQAPVELQLPWLQMQELYAGHGRVEISPPGAARGRSRKFMVTATTADADQDRRVRRHRSFLYVATWVAGAATTLVPTLVFSEKHIFGETPLRERLPLAGIVFLEYALSFMALVVDSRLAFGGGFVLASAAIMTLASGTGGVIVGIFSMWGWGHLQTSEVWALSFLGFAFFSNVVFLGSSVLYARAIRTRISGEGFLLGLGASLGLAWLYFRHW